MKKTVGAKFMKNSDLNVRHKTIKHLKKNNQTYPKSNNKPI